MVDLVEIDRRPGVTAASATGHAIEALENGEVLYLPHDAFAMTNREHLFLDPAIVKQPRRHSGRARIIYLPAAGRLLKTTLQGDARAELQAMMARFSSWAQQLVADLLPAYLPGLTPGPATFRPCPRSGPQRLHVDSFFFFPTEGRRVLRVLTNIDPDGRPRVWQFGEEPFEQFASRLMPQLHRPVARQRLAFGKARDHQGLPHALRRSHAPDAQHHQGRSRLSEEHGAQGGRISRPARPGCCSPTTCCTAPSRASTPSSRPSGST